MFYKPSDVKECPPRVVIPTNIMFQNTNTACLGRTDVHDIVHHTYSNTNVITELEGKLKTLSTDRDRYISEVKSLVKELSFQHEKYVLYSIADRTQGLELPEMIFTESNTEEVNFTELNKLFGNENSTTKSLYHKTEMVNLKTRIKELTNNIKKLNAEMPVLNMNLMSEQMKYIREMQMNPPKVLSGEEILENYNMNQLNFSDE
jgi:hypothetical protein